MNYYETYNLLKTKEKYYAFLDAEVIKNYGDYPALFIILFPPAQVRNLKKIEREIKRLRKNLIKYVKSQGGYHNACPELTTYEEWCKYLLQRTSFLTPEDLEYERILRQEYIKRKHLKEED